MTGGGASGSFEWASVLQTMRHSGRSLSGRQLRYSRQTRNHRRYRRPRSDYANNKKRSRGRIGGEEGVGERERERPRGRQGFSGESDSPTTKCHSMNEVSTSKDDGETSAFRLAISEKRCYGGSR
ncbi:hypothetical protein V1478_015105, partial [Vespula squamosa]